MALQQTFEKYTKLKLKFLIQDPLFLGAFLITISYKDLVFRSRGCSVVRWMPFNLSHSCTFSSTLFHPSPSPATPLPASPSPPSPPPASPSPPPHIQFVQQLHLFINYFSSFSSRSPFPSFLSPSGDLEMDLSGDIPSHPSIHPSDI